MKWSSYITLLIIALLSSCEDVIDIDLKDVSPKLVIIANVTVFEEARVTISRTVPFAAEQPFDPVSGAEVMLIGMEGYTTFQEVSPGHYAPQADDLTVGGHVIDLWSEFRLLVVVDGEQFTATASMPQPVVIDSVGTTVGNVFGEERKFVSVKYRDPPDTANYYLFLQSVNGSPFKMVYVTNDKFNDGKYVTEDLVDFDTELTTGDLVVVRMQCIDKATYDFWNAVQSTNPGTAAPANPPSVFYGALGYFSIHTVSQVTTVVQ